MVLFIVELSVTFSVEKNVTLNTTLNSTNLDTLLLKFEQVIHNTNIFTQVHRYVNVLLVELLRQDFTHHSSSWMNHLFSEKMHFRINFTHGKKKIYSLCTQEIRPRSMKNMTILVGRKFFKIIAQQEYIFLLKLMIT